MKSYRLIIFSLLVGQWNTSLPPYASFLSFGSFGSLLLRFLFLCRVYQFVAIPLGLATGLSGFSSLVKEVRKLALRLGISVHMLQHNWLIRANSCQRLILQLFLRVGSWGRCSSQGQGFLSIQQLVLP